MSNPKKTSVLDFFESFKGLLGHAICGGIDVCHFDGTEFLQLLQYFHFHGSFPETSGPEMMDCRSLV